MKLGNLEVVMKNHQTFNGREGIGLNGDIYVNGKKTVYYMDDAGGGGGCWRGVFDRELLDLLEEEIKNHPPTPFEEDEFHHHEWEYDCDSLANELLGEIETLKFEKQLQRKCKTCVCWGIPGSGTYQFYNLKAVLAKWKVKDISQLPAPIIDKWLPTDLKKDEVLFNKNIPQYSQMKHKPINA